MKYILAFLTLCATQFGFAQSFDDLKISEKLLANEVILGGKTIRLPSGNWYTAAKHKSAVTNSGIHTNNSIYSVYLARIENNQFVAGALIHANHGSTGGRGWTMEGACGKAQNEIYKQEFGTVSYGNSSECLLIYKRQAHLIGTTSGNIFPQAQDWLRQNNLLPKGSFYQIQYEILVAGNMGTAMLFIPTKDVTNEGDLKEYGEQFANRLRKVLTQREKVGSIPEMPVAQPVITKPLGATPTPQHPLLNEAFRKNYPNTKFADLSDTTALPSNLSSSCKTRYGEWLKNASPRGFAIGANGACGFAWGTKPPRSELPSDPAERALMVCDSFEKSPCKLYAMDDEVVWKP